MMNLIQIRIKRTIKIKQRGISPGVLA